LVLPQTTISYSSGTATAYGSGGVVNAYGTGTTTTYGSQTMMMPYSVARFDVAALFFVKTQSRLGVLPGPVDDDTRKRLQTNLGIKVLEVMEGSPAFLADVLPGDVVLSIADQPIQSPEHMIKLLDKYEGQPVTLKIDRDGKAMEKQLQIGTYTKSSQ
jgi:S1-C subfamily serine protease